MGRLVTPDARPSPARPWLALLVVAPASAIGTWAAITAFPGPVGRSVWLVTKLWVIAVPILWHVYVDGGRFHLPRFSSEGLGKGLLWGVLMAGTILGAWFLVLRGPTFGGARDVIKASGLDTPTKYLVMAVYWTTLNSLIEEYVWRWFVTSQAMRVLSVRGAVLLAAFLFTMHHYAALAAYVSIPLTLLGCAGVFVAGAIWSWLFASTKSIWSAYASHALADIAVFVVGYDILFVL